MAGERIIQNGSPLGQKYSLVDEGISEFEFQKNPSIVLPCGVKITTNSMELHRDISEIIAQLPNSDTFDSSQVVHYVVNDSLTGNEMLSTEVVEGNIAVSPDISQALLVGPNKIGSVFSVSYGLRSLYQVRQGWLGVHSAMILDRSDNNAILICGSNGTGKSTLAYGLHYDIPQRFTVVTDEWNDIDISGQTANAVSFVIGQPKDQPIAKLVDQDPELLNACTSYGKSWYLHRNATLGNFNYRVKRIFFLAGKDAPTDLGYMFRRINLNVPFINTRKQFIPSESINESIESYITGGVNLMQNPITKMVRTDSLSVRETLNYLHESL